MKLKNNLREVLVGLQKTLHQTSKKNFEKKHLKHYLKGNKQFQHGKDPETNMPNYVLVKQVLTEV